MKTKRKSGSSYLTAKGVHMRQLNFSVSEETAERFDNICMGLSRSVIFTQMLNSYVKNDGAEEPTPTYSILSEE